MLRDLYKHCLHQFKRIFFIKDRFSKISVNSFACATVFHDIGKYRSNLVANICIKVNYGHNLSHVFIVMVWIVINRRKI